MTNTHNNQFKARKSLGVSFPYFAIILLVCVLPTLLIFLEIDYKSLFLAQKNKKHNIEALTTGSVFSSIWVLFSISTGVFTLLLTYFDFKVKKDITTPIIGITLFCVALIDMLFVLIANEVILLKTSYDDALYATWFTSSTLTALFLIIGTGILTLIRSKSIRNQGQKTKLLKSLGFLFALTAILSIITILTLHKLPYLLEKGNTFIRRPSEFITVILFLFWGAIIMPKIIKIFPSIFSRILILCLIPATFASIHMSISDHPFDADFNIALFLKLITFIIPLIGVSLHYARNIAKQHEKRLDLKKEVENREKTQRELESKQNLLKHAENIANMGIWELKLSNKEMIWSDSLYKIFGLSSLNVRPSLMVMLDMVTPKYRDELAQKINDSVNTNQPFSLEYQITTSDGSIRYIQGQGQYIPENKKTIGTCLDITNLKETSSKLEQSEALLKEAQAISHNGSFEWQSSTNSIIWSDELYRIHGLNPKSVKIDIGFYQTLVHPDDIKRCINIVQKALNLNKNFVLEYRIVKPNNEIRFLYGTVKIIKDEDNNTLKVFGTIQDITELKNTAILLEKTESIYKTIAKNVPDSAVLMYDKDYNLILFEGPIIDKLSFKTNPTIGINAKELYANEEYKEIKKQLEKAFLGEETQLQKEVNNTYYKVNYIPVKNIQEEIFSVMIVKQNISEIKAAQQNLESKVDELNRSNQDLEQFAYVASHDLQEPLRKIRAFGDRLQTKFSSDISEEGLDYIKRMQNASERMQILIDDLLTYSRVSRAEDDYQTTDLHEQIQKVLENLEFSIEKKNATIDIMVNHKINAIPAQIRQLFQNLISNAIKFTKEDVTPYIEIKSEVISGNSLNYENINHAKDYCIITIKDNGIGFDEQYSSKIFALFQRLHSRNEYPGTGIGLAVCKKIVEQHKGQIQVTSKPDFGTTFTLIFPTA